LLLSRVSNVLGFRVYPYVFFLVKQGVSFKGLYNVLSTQPVLNKVRNITFVIMKIKQTHYMFFLTVVGLAQSLEHLTAEQEVVDSIHGAAPVLIVLK